jgi:hypothetical protein
MTQLYDFEALTIDGREQKLGEFAGKALLIVIAGSLFWAFPAINLVIKSRGPKRRSQLSAI